MTGSYGLMDITLLKTFGKIANVPMFNLNFIAITPIPMKTDQKPMLDSKFAFNVPVKVL